VKTALVTGAGRGIGAATVRSLVAAGWGVVALDIAADIPGLSYPMATADELDAVVADLGENTVAVRADVRDVASLRVAVALAEQRWGGLDAAVSCAGVIAGGQAQAEVPPEVEQLVLDINLTGTLNLARATVPALLRRPEPRSGRFIAVASTAATYGLQTLAAYCASKAGVTGLVRALAVELGGTGVTANAVSPGSTATSILDESARIYDLASVEEFAAHQTINRLLTPDEVAAMIAFVAGDGGASMTGADVPVNGGFSV
jgi:SDR family mycofactocin-dependent oxidoreductase